MGRRGLTTACPIWLPRCFDALSSISGAVPSEHKNFLCFDIRWSPPKEWFALAALRPEYWMLGVHQAVIMDNDAYTPIPAKF